jgi:hypothetical protein
MSEETLLSAARRVARFFRIDEAHGGLTSRDTLIAFITLDKEIERETARLKAIEEQKNAESPALDQPLEVKL